MPTRTINLKLILGKTPDTTELKHALWVTHSQINRAVASIEKMLLLCRGKSYWTLVPVDNGEQEVLVPEEFVREEALAMARAAQSRNGRSGEGSDAEVLTALRTLYEEVVKSCRLYHNDEPLNGDAKSIGTRYAGPLFDIDTCQIKEGKGIHECGPFAETAGKIFKALPEWIRQIDKVHFDRNNPSHFKIKDENGEESCYEVNSGDADRWYDSPDVQEMLASNKSFNKDGWKKNKEKGKADWAVELAKKQLSLARDPRVAIREKLWKELGLLPLGTPYFDKNKVANLWNRLGLRLAVAHLLSWESWNHNTQKEHKKAKADVSRLNEEYLPLAPLLEKLRQYEKERHQKLREIAFVDENRPFKIGGRAIRGWQRVREAWEGKGNTATERLEILKDLQTRLGGKFGDPDLFRWLAADGREGLWRETDALSPLVKLNIAERLLAERKEYALMTFADPKWHPRWAMYEAVGGSNLRNYTLTPNDGGIALDLQLLHLDETGTCIEKPFQVNLAPSGQLKGLKVENVTDGNKPATRLHYRSSHQNFTGEPRGAELLFDRNYLEHGDRSESSLTCQPGPVWLKMTLDVKSMAPENWLDGRGRVATPAEVHHFNTALSNKSKHTEKLSPGLQVLSIDMGLRTFATCSVFELVSKQPEKGLYLSLADLSSAEGYWAKHLRSFKLALPGETPSKKEKAARQQAIDELYSLRSDIRTLKDILRISVIENSQARDEAIAAFMETLAGRASDSAINSEQFTGFGDSRFQSTSELWQHHCQTHYDQAEKAVAERFRQWRRRTSPKSGSWEEWRERRGYHGGKSYWMIEYLEGVRKVILSWSLRGRSYGEVNRQDKSRYGSVASRLLQHINNLKSDRIKSGADLIVQAARGYVPIEGYAGWSKKHDPCRVILFEDLARYRFKVDRPRRENSQLMKWAHREIITETTMQAELYGLTVETTAAGFSSRFLASNGAPGFRCRHLSEDDFDNGRPKPYVVYQLEWMLGNRKNKELPEMQEELAVKIKPGLCVPWSGGELFASFVNGKIRLIHADVNAAQSLQRRFWGRCGDAYRISGKQVPSDGAEAYELDKPGARLLGALQTSGQRGLRLVADKEAVDRGILERFSISDGQEKTKKSAIAPTADDPEMSELEEMLEEAELSGHSNRETFFRDASGEFFSSRYWYRSKTYWPVVRQKIWSVLKNQQGMGSGHAGADDDTE